MSLFLKFSFFLPCEDMLIGLTQIGTVLLFNQSSLRRLYISPWEQVFSFREIIEGSMEG